MKKDYWIIKVFILSFILSIIFSSISNNLANLNNNIILVIVLILVIIIGILFDIIGTSVISANESTFRSLDSKKKSGAKEALYLITNSSKVSSICNDIIGDVSGIISGSIGAILAISISSEFYIGNTIIAIIIASLISSLTVGGKAIFKKYAIKNADKIVLNVSKLLHIFAIKKK